MPYKTFATVTLSFLLILISAISISAAKPYKDPYAEYDEFEHMDPNIGLDDNILVPTVGDGERKDVRKYMKGIYEDLKKRNYNVSTLREGEVVMITIPCSKLFLPNDTLLWAGQANKLLDPLKPLFSDSDLFKIVFSVNSDNTGSESYNNNLSDLRQDSLYDWFVKNSDDDLIVVPYSMGAGDPVATNDTRDGRELNRRVEIYLVPGPKIIDLAHNKKLLSK